MMSMKVQRFRGSSLTAKNAAKITKKKDMVARKKKKFSTECCNERFFVKSEPK